MRTSDCQNRLCDIAEKRQGEWGKTILERIHHVIDLPAADAFHHQMWNVNFRSSRSIPLQHATLSNPTQKILGDLLIRFGLILSTRLVLLVLFVSTICISKYE